jgi:hypothetical protein
MMTEKKTKNLSLKQLILCLLVLTGGCLLVYTCWKMREVPESGTAPGDYSRMDTASFQEDVQPTAPADASECFRLYVEKGEILVYDESQRESFSTGLSFELLPDTIQLEITEGKFFDSEEALLEFLENYSS